MTAPDQYRQSADPNRRGMQPPPAPAPGGTTPGAPTPGAGEAKRRGSAGQILAGLLFVVVLVFIIENSRQVRVRLIFPEVQAPLYVPILIAAVLGALIGALLRYRRQHRRPR